jgi:cystathionine beta-synthase
MAIPARNEAPVSILDGVEYYESILDTVGDTPLVRFRELGKGLPCPVLGKVEFFNPGGSVKDRIGMAMVEDMERQGRLKPGGTIVECTSGNTGLGLAMVAAVRGYRSAFCMPDKVSSEKVNLLKAFGAEVFLSPTSVTPDHPDSYYSVARRIAKERTGAVLMDQYNNPANPAAHYATTGPELWKQTKGRITHFIAGMGTGGTITGTARYLKEQNPKIQVIGADPVGSILKQYKETGTMGEAHTYKIEGVGEDFIPLALDFGVVDKVISCTDRDGLNTARRLAREEAIFVGGSSGMAAWVGVQVARTCGPNDIVVVLLPDTGERYLTKVHNDEWMRDNHLMDLADARVEHLLSGKPRLRQLISVNAGEPLKRALALIEQHDVSQLPVMRDGEVVGTLEEGEVLRLALSDRGALEKPVDVIMGPALPVVGASDSADVVTKLLAARTSAVLVRDGKGISGILTRYDMLQFIAGGE